MAASTKDLISAARELDPAGRALLNLWLHRGLDDVAIARLSGGSADEVAERRRRIVDEIAAEVDAEPGEVQAALDELAGGPPAPVTAAPPEIVLPPAVEPEHRAGATRERKSKGPSPIPVALGIAVGLVLVVTVFVAALAGGSEESPSATPAPTPSATPSAADLAPVPGGPAGVSGTAAVSGDRLELDVRGLDGPPRDYEVWLFNSVADARSLGRLDAGTFDLPPDREGFRFLDVSREPGGNPNHSGRSVVRAPAP